MRIPALAKTALTIAAGAALLATLAAAPAQAAAGGSPAGARREDGQIVTVPLYEAIEQLTEADEDRTGYVRSAFRHWVDADRNGCDARKEVILAEALVAPTVGAKCALTGGQWLSLYDDVTTPTPRRSTSTTWSPSPRPGTPEHLPGPPPSARPTPTTWMSPGR